MASNELETMAVIQKYAEQLRRKQKAIERAMLDISLKDKIINVEIK